MSRVRDLLQTKGAQVHTISPTASVLEAAELMNEHKIGSLLVMEDDQLIGIFTERDILRRVVAEELSPADTPVGEVMSSELVCCSPATSLEEARGAMKNRRIRHLPVIEDGRLAGLISIGDLNARAQAESELTIFLMDEYIHGRT